MKAALKVADSTQRQTAEVGNASERANAAARIGALVRLIRERNEWRQIDLAKRANVSANTVIGLEAGRRTHDRNVEKIAKALSTTGAALRRGEIPEGISGLVAASAMLREMTDEDIAIARQFHNATTAIRAAVIVLLRSGRRDITERLANLEPQRQATVLDVLDTEENDQRMADRSSNKHA